MFVKSFLRQEKFAWILIKYIRNFCLFPYSFIQKSVEIERLVDRRHVRCHGESQKYFAILTIYLQRILVIIEKEKNHILHLLTCVNLNTANAATELLANEPASIV